MSITVVCPKCKHAYSVQNQFAGHSARCKACRSKMTVPALDASSKSHRPANSAASKRSSAQGFRSEDPMSLLKLAAAMERSAQVEPAPVVEVSITARPGGFGQKFKALFSKR